MTCTILSSGDEFRTLCWNESEKPFSTIKAKVWETVWDLYCRGYDNFYVNCDYGTPMWAAEFILNLKAGNEVKLHIMTPYEEQTTDWPEELRNRYFDIHAKADSVTLAHTQYDSFCYQDTDEKMIDESDLLLLFGSENGAPFAEEYAEKKGVPIEYQEIIKKPDLK
ncbi:MAG: DUF1273 domain-containing protein [Oscillospiraceae bacterium]|nr:DUF1273 domain-containing protein [Oscillospiraceae bacterium]